jgi:hypothetical protein
MQPVDPIDLVIPLRIAVHANTARELLVAPLWFLHADGAFWCASQARSLIVRALQREPSCAFDLSTNDMPYRGVAIEGRAEIVDDSDDVCIRAIVRRYLEPDQADAMLSRLDGRGTRVILRIVPQRVRPWAIDPLPEAGA